MTRSRVLASAVAALVAGGAILHGQNPAEPYTPTPGMPGKDSVWVPTPPALIERMLDVAGVTADDYVIDLGSGDGRMVIAAAKRGAQALGIEFNPDLVELSRQVAREEGVSDRATFAEGDMFATDISKATVLALFMLPDQLRKLTPQFLGLAPGSRIVVNTFGIPEWPPDVVEQAGAGCEAWCEAKLYIVPAKVRGTWQLPDATLVLDQSFQQVSGTLTAGTATVPLAEVVLKGADISFAAGSDRYAGRVHGDTMEGTVASGSTERPFTATRRPD